MRTSIRLLCLLICLVGVFAGVHQAKEKGRPTSDAEHWAAIFDDPARDEWQKPITLFTFLGIQNGAIVADLGAGTGYFTRLLSIQVGAPGKVYAVDIEQAMLDHLQSRDDIVQERVVPILAEPNDPMLPENEIDLVLTANTWHHIKKRTRYVRRLEKSLTPEGRVAVIDFHVGELPVGPPARDKVSRDRVIAEFEAAGWRFVAESVALPYQYVLIFRPPRDPNRLFSGS